MEKFYKTDLEIKKQALHVFNMLGITDVKLSDFSVKDAKALLKTYNKAYNK